MVAIVALTMCHKTELARKRQGRPIAAAIQHPMQDLVIPPIFAVSNPAMKDDDPGWSTSTSTTDGNQ